MKNSSSIEDVSFREQQDTISIEDGYHDLAPGAPWQENRHLPNSKNSRTTPVARAPMQDVGSSRRTGK